MSVAPSGSCNVRRALSVLARGLLCLLLAAATGGCGLLGGGPPGEMLLVTGYGEVPGEVSPLDDGQDESVAQETKQRPRRKKWLLWGSRSSLPEWASESLEVEAGAPISQDANSHVEGLMVARRQARDDALRQLAARVAGLPTLMGDTVGARLQANPDLRQRVERTLRDSCQFPPDGKDTDREVALTARLELAPIAQEIWGAEGQGPESRSGTSRPPKPRWWRRKFRPPDDPLYRRAFMLAEKDGRLKMLQSVRSESLFPNFSIELRMASDPDMAVRVLEAVEKARIVEVEYPRPGACKMVLALDIEKLLGRLRD